MSRLTQALPIPPRMYRHFAVVTVVLTLIIAIFADGENREVLGNEIASQKQQTRMRDAEAKKFGPKKLAANDFHPRGGAGWGSDGPVDPSGSIGGGSDVSVTRENGDVERAQNQDLGVMGPGPMLQSRGGNIARSGPLIPQTRRKPSAEQRARLERSGFEAAAGNGPVPKS